MVWEGQLHDTAYIYDTEAQVLRQYFRIFNNIHVKQNFLKFLINN